MTRLLNYIVFPAVLLLSLSQAAASDFFRCSAPVEDLFILLDVGHTLKSPGAISARGRSEYEFNLNLALEIQKFFHTNGLPSTQLFITRQSNISKRRTQLQVLRPDILVSIHHDSVQSTYLKKWRYNQKSLDYSDTFSGYSIFVSKRSPAFENSLLFGKLFGFQLLMRGFQYSEHHNEPIPGENRSFIDRATGVYNFNNLAILRQNTFPSILFEAGIIKNRKDELKLRKNSTQISIANALHESIVRLHHLLCTSPLIKRLHQKSVKK